MSPAVRAKEPVIRQVFIGRGPDVIVPDALERKLYVIRKTASGTRSRRCKLTHGTEFYVPSHVSAARSSTRACCSPTRSASYYKDLQDPRVDVGAGAGAPALLDQHLPRRGTWRIRSA